MLLRPLSPVHHDKKCGQAGKVKGPMGSHRDRTPLPPLFLHFRSFRPLVSFRELPHFCGSIFDQCPPSVSFMVACVIALTPAAPSCFILLLHLLLLMLSCPDGASTLPPGSAPPALFPSSPCTSRASLVSNSTSRPPLWPSSTRPHPDKASQFRPLTHLRGPPASPWTPYSAATASPE